MRIAGSTALLAAVLLSAPVLARAEDKTPPAPSSTPAAPPSGQSSSGASSSGPAKPATAANKPKPDTVIATVDGNPIRLEDLSEAAQALPENMRHIPGNMLYPMLLDQLVDRQALALEARKQGLDKDPEVQHAMQRAADSTLEAALIRKEVAPQVTDAAVKARYEHDIAGKTGEEEVHARHILVSSEDEAKKIIAQLKGGADFAQLAKEHSTDQSGAAGGDLGYFKKSDMLPEFSAVAFSLKPGEISPTPVHTRYGWHVIQVLDKRTAKPPSFDEAKDELRQQMVREDVQKAVEDAKKGRKIEEFNVDGSPMKAADRAQPPGSPAH